MKVKRKGFTLAELLIVITVIGVLASMMMVSSNEAVSTARATDLIGNLRALKGAALMHYVDSIDTYTKVNRGTDEQFDIDRIKKYIDVAGLKENGYNVLEGSDGRWYVGYIFNQNDTDVIPKLAARAKTLGLLKATAAKDAFSVSTGGGGDASASEAGGDDDSKYFDGVGDVKTLGVAMQVR